MTKYSSELLCNFVDDLEEATLEERDQIWAAIETPLIENIPSEPDNCLVTFLYRLEQDHTPKPSIYLYSSFTGLPCSESSKLSLIENTDIEYLSLVLANKLRSTYSFLIVDEQSTKKDHHPVEAASIFPHTTGKFKAADDLLIPYYDKSAQDAYPVMVFLDGSDYINPIPTPAILDGMIKVKIIQPCVAVFLEYSSNQRFHEYNCNDKFTSFLANDFMQRLRTENKLHITGDPRLSTIVGLSASGLASFYAALTYPEVFGNVIAQSPSWVLQQTHALDKLIHDHWQSNQEGQFIIEMGSNETIPIDMEFGDGTIQSLSPLEASKQVVESMKKHGLTVEEHEFIGGHNNVCWAVSLPNHIQTIFTNRLDDEFNTAFESII